MKPKQYWLITYAARHGGETHMDYEAIDFSPVDWVIGNSQPGSGSTIYTLVNALPITRAEYQKLTEDGLA